MMYPRSIPNQQSSPLRQSSGMLSRQQPQSCNSAPLVPRRRNSCGSSSTPMKVHRQMQQQLLQATSHHGTTPQRKDKPTNSKTNASGSSSSPMTTSSGLPPILKSMYVKLTVLRGEDLAPKDRNWKGEATSSDPYVIVKLVSACSKSNAPAQEVVLGKTETVNESLNPVWKEKMEVSLGSVNLDSKYSLQFTIMDEDFATKDDRMGEVVVPLNLAEPVHSTTWYDIPTDSANNARGKLQIALQTKLHYVNGESAVAEAPKRKPSVSPQTPRKTRQPAQKDVEFLELALTVIQGEGLVAKDRNMLGQRTTSDPYVEVMLLPDGIPGYKELSLGLTQTIPKTLNPVWKDDFSVAVPVSTLSDKSTLRLSVYDYDKLSADDSMGVVEIPLPRSFSFSPPTWYGIPVASAKNASGRLQCALTTKVRCISDLEVERVVVAHDAMKDQPETSIKTVIPDTLAPTRNSVTDSITFAVTVLAGTGLAAKDRNLLGKRTTSDPYVEVKLLTTAPSNRDDVKEIMLGRTQVMYQTLSPVWNERFMTTLQGHDLVKLNEARLQLTVYDQDVATQDDCMGSIMIPVPLVNTTTSLPRWYGIPKHSATNASGRLHVQLDTTVVYASSQLRRSDEMPKASRSRPGLVHRTSVRKLQATARSRDSSAFCTPRRTRPKQLKSDTAMKAPLPLGSSGSPSGDLRSKNRRRASSPPAPSEPGRSQGGSEDQPRSDATAQWSSLPPRLKTEGKKHNSDAEKSINTSKSHTKNHTRRRASSPAPATEPLPNGSSNTSTTSKYMADVSLSVSGGTNATGQSKTIPQLPRSSSKSRFAQQFCTPRRSRPRETVSGSTRVLAMPKIQPISPEEDGKRIKRSASKSNVEEMTSIYCTPRRTSKLKTRPTSSFISMPLGGDATANTSKAMSDQKDIPPAAPVASMPAGEPNSTGPNVVSIVPQRRRPKTTWVCNCGYESAKSRNFCGMCSTPQFWACRECAFGENLCIYKYCGMCGVQRHEKAAPTAQAATNNKSSHDNVASQVPLQAY